MSYHQSEFMQIATIMEKRRKHLKLTQLDVGELAGDKNSDNYRRFIYVLRKSPEPDFMYSTLKKYFKVLGIGIKIETGKG